MGKYGVLASSALVCALLAGGLGGCQATKPVEAARPTGAPLFAGMGGHHRKITTPSEHAQRYFDQGLTWVFSFNHDEAIRSFQEALKQDPDCAMAWWGIALANGPHINNPAMDAEHSRAAWDALNRAAALAGRGTPAEQALVQALRARYADPAKGTPPATPEERAALDRAYAGAMKGVYATYKTDADIATLYAESLMDLRPWDLWTVSGEPRPETPEVLATLEQALRVNPDHPGANHLYIHAVEAGPMAAKGIPSADRLRTLVRASGHMVHMPGHIDVRVGQWARAAEQNRQAIRIDAGYRRLSPRQGFYNIYMAHNNQFLAWACMNTGRKAECLAAARAMMEGVPKEFIEGSPEAIDGYLHLELEAFLRFGEWDRVLAEPEPPATLPIKRAFWRYARATALAAKKDIAAAEREQAEFVKAVGEVPAGRLMAINDAHTTLDIARHSLAGEIAYQRGSIDDAVDHLRKAVEIEDTLRYMEPPDWVWPVRHQLGAVLVSAGRHAEAEKVYREDLKKWPENGWALFGLAECLRAQDSPEAAAVEARFKKVWAGADYQISSTCSCVAGK
ncbi:MAG: tetratricopeptide repeat protein [Phycisphaerales bacterium]|nr:tetratricopeptide repeat protein [Phycisphaerales bacterium]